MTRQHREGPLSAEEKLLMKYLDQYALCRHKKLQLEHRKQEILTEFDYPISGIKYDGMPKGNKLSDSSANLAIKLDEKVAEIETKILKQKEKTAQILLEVMSVIECLPLYSRERDILELKFIDSLKWEDVCKVVSMSRSAAYKYFKDGLSKLLTFEKVQKILEEFKQRLEDEGVCS